ncbi:unnamed protein product [Urochloa humidicola]
MLAHRRRQGPPRFDRVGITSRLCAVPFSCRCDTMAIETATTRLVFFSQYAGTPLLAAGGPYLPPATFSATCLPWLLLSSGLLQVCNTNADNLFDKIPERLRWTMESQKILRAREQVEGTII